MAWAGASAWRHALLTGATFAVLVVASYRLQSASWTSALLRGLTSAVIVGAVSGPIQARQQREELEVAGDLDRDARRRATRAASWGEVPADPEVRAAAARLAAYRWQEGERLRWLGTAGFLVLAGFALWVATTMQPWMWLVVAFFVLAIAAQQWSPRHYRGREALLVGDHDGGDVVPRT